MDISLTAEGTDKMIKATRGMKPGSDRIAIIVDGKLRSAPVVQHVPLGKNFIISGLRKEGEPARLAERLSGKNRKKTPR